jgi:four helix bundle protein
MVVNSFKELEVWQQSMNLIKDVYGIANQLPPHDRYTLGDQMRRSVISIASNIAEGSKRGSKVSFRHFCSIAAGSSAELETQLLAAQSIYKTQGIDSALEKLLAIQMMLTKLRQSLAVE